MSLTGASRPIAASSILVGIGGTTDIKQASPRCVSVALGGEVEIEQCWRGKRPQRLTPSRYAQRRSLTSTRLTPCFEGETVGSNGSDVMKARSLGRTALVACGALVATAGISAKAATVALPDVSSSVTAITNDPTTTVTTDPSSVSVPNASGSITISPFVNIQTTSTGLGGNLGGQSAESLLTYYFAAIGGTPGSAVTVDVQTNLMTSALGAAYAFSEIDVGPTLEETVCTDTSQCTNSQFNGTLQLTVNSGTAVQVHFEVISETNVAFTGTASASADPMISIDPSTLNPQLYSIILSDGVGNGLPLTTTPLPAALPLFAGGLGMVGFLARRRKQKTTA